ncbi:hypothetical protein [Glycomyces paridis]|uniref:Uncharacterized protein n=1 Tax=Glycomyces paridis TaxID=2126555 RepID=A0A4S8PNU0_9ACTN|nr:hypothetical protein [Glycomyces paridis]THV31435.1 hypothetical protein E9998_03470 [Glycomyces paridis]
MTHPQMPPPPPDRMHLAPAQGRPPAYPAAHGPAYPPPVPVPGGERIAKPGSVTGVQVILTVMGSLYMAGALAAIALAPIVEPIAIGGLVAVYFAVHACVCAVQIGRGREWAWVWTLVHTIIWCLLALVGIVGGVVNLAYDGGASLLSGVVFAGLYGTLLGMLLVSPTRTWNRLHRKEPGRPDPVVAEPDRPASKPGSVGFAQFALAALILPTPVATWAFLEWVRTSQGTGTLGERLEQYPEFMCFIVLGVALVLATLVVNPIVAVRLGAGRPGARMFGAAWLGTLVAAEVYLVSIAAIAVIDGTDGAGDDAIVSPVVVFGGLGLAVLGVVLALGGLIAVGSRGARSWAPFHEVHPGPQYAAPYGPPAGYGAPQQYPPHPGGY